MEYDIAAKVVLEHAKETLLRWFAGLEPEQVELLEALPQETVSLRRSDFPLWVRTQDDQEHIVLLEFQTRWERDVPLRLAEYAIRFRLKYALPVQSIVVVFRRSGNIPEVYEDATLRYRYGVVRLWEASAEEVLAGEEWGLYPFIPLMAGEEGTVFDAAERLYTSELARREKADLLTALTIFAGFRSDSLVQRLLRERRDIMSESIAYEIIKREGHQEGHQEGRQEGMLEEAREMVLRAVSVRFRVIPADVEQQVKAIPSRATLGSLLEQVIRSTNLTEFRDALREATSSVDDGER